MTIQSSSEVCGEVLSSSATKRRSKVYRALRPVLCAECPHVIAIGEMFTRRELQGVALAPQCRECAPFELAAQGQSQTEALLTNLLASAAPERVPAAHNERAQQEVQQRIGPALERVNRGQT